jgi:molybdopterin molybdotransferase
MGLLPLEDAKAQILAGVEHTKAENVALLQAANRVLAGDLAARRNQPPFAGSSMDGYAVLGSDVATAPIDLTVIGEAPAGRAFDGSLEEGQAVRIFTGAPLPDGADTVIMQENTSRNGNVVTINQSAKTGNFVRPVGLDFKDGQVVLRDKTFLNSRNLGLCAAMNYAQVPVHKKPVVAILATGDELVEPGRELGPDQIVSSNSIALAAAVKSFGGMPLDLGIVPDDLDTIVSAIDKARQADVLLTIGGASVGDHDLIGPAFEKLGISMNFWKVAMRPGKPLMFAQRNNQRILGLPGNPVSSLVCAFIFLKPLIEKMLGLNRVQQSGMAELTEPLRENDLRQDHLRAQLSRNADGKLLISPFSQQDSSMQLTLALADALIVRPPHAPALAKGDLVPYLSISF